MSVITLCKKFRSQRWGSSLPGTIEAIGKYLLILCPLILRLNKVHILDVLSLIFRCKSNESIFRSLRGHLHSIGERVDQGQETVHDVGGGVVQKQYACGLSSNFQAKFNGTTGNGSSDKLYYVVGEQVEYGQEGVHDVCDGVVCLFVCLFYYPNLQTLTQGLEGVSKGY